MDLLVPPLDVSEILTWTQAQHAYKSGKRSFVCYPRYPLVRKPNDFRSCEKCTDGCALIRFDHRDTGYLDLTCYHCGAGLQGGLYNVGVTTKTAAKNPDRLFSCHEREQIFKRDATAGSVRCFRCGATPDQDELEADHIIPFAMGGPTQILNGITLCKQCNTVKSAGYDEDFVTRALIHTHRLEFPPSCKGTGATMAVLRSVANSLKAWKLGGTS